MRAPADGWDREEREAIDDLQEELERLQVRHQHDPDVDLLRAAQHDALPPDLQSVARDRLLSDPWARALIDGLDAAEPPLDAADQDRLLARVQRDAHRGAVAAGPWTWLRPLLASMVVAAVAVGVWIATRPTSPQPPLASVPRESPPATPPAPVFHVPLDKPDVAVSLAALTWRGGGADNPLLADLKAPLDAFRSNDYQGAERGFAALESRYPDAVEVFFYGGVSRLFLNTPQPAVAALTRARALADATFAPRTAWYLAIAEERSGNRAQARRLLDALCRGTSDRAAPACAAIKQIDAAPHAR